MNSTASDATQCVNSPIAKNHRLDDPVWHVKRTPSGFTTLLPARVVGWTRRRVLVRYQHDQSGRTHRVRPEHVRERQELAL